VFAYHYGEKELLPPVLNNSRVYQDHVGKELSTTSSLIFDLEQFMVIVNKAIV
jgi:hypothetical protein